MREIIALVVGIGFGVIAIGLNVNGYISKTFLGFLLVFAIAVGIAIANYDRLIRFKGGGIDMEMAKKEVDSAVDSGIEEIKKEVKRQKDEISLLINTANDQEEKLRKTIKMAEPPTLSFLDSNVVKTDLGYKAILRFKPSKNQPLGQIILIAKITDETSAKITNFWPKPGPPFTTGPDSKKISNDGKEARLAYGIMAVGYPEVELNLSESAKVMVSGNLLIEPVVLEIK